MKRFKKKLKELDIVHENGDYWVADEGNRYTVYHNMITHAQADSSYHHNADGLSIAIYRCNYLAKTGK